MELHGKPKTEKRKEKEKMNNISLVMGRGIEGCGVTKFTIEQAKFYAKNDYNYKIWASKDKTWSRKNAHTDIENLEHIKFKED